MLVYLFWLSLPSCASYPIRLQDSLIINICVENQVILVFLFEDNHQGKAAPETTTFWLGVMCCVRPHLIRLMDSLISNKTGNNQLMFLLFCKEIIMKER